MDEHLDFEGKVRNGVFIPRLQGNTKPEIIRELVDALAASGKLPDPEEAFRAVMDREATMSTGLEHGVALPHGKSHTVSGLVTAFGLKPEGVDFEALDGNPSTLFVLVISAVTQAALHMQFLGQLGRGLMCPAVRDKLMHASTIDDVADTLIEQ